MATIPVLLAERATRAQRTDIVVIGSSLMAYAVPVSGHGATSLLGDQRSHRRVAERRMTETSLLNALDLAIAQHSSLVLLEANPLLVDFGDQSRRRSCDGIQHMIRNTIAAERRRVPEAFRTLFQLPLVYSFSSDPPNLASKHVISPTIIRELYPLTIRAPCDEPRLEAAVARAKAQGTQVVLVLPPRSPDADRLLGPKVTSELGRRVQELADRLGIDVFAAEGQWPNEEFVDTAHLNIIGRGHFRRALRQWWASRQ